MIYSTSFKDCHDPSKVPLYRRVDDLQGIGSVKSHNGIMALGSVIRAVPVFSVLHCADKCLRRKHCTHFNYYLKTGSGMVCELLKKVKSHRNISQEVIFYEFSRENFNKVGDSGQERIKGLSSPGRPPGPLFSCPGFELSGRPGSPHPLANNFFRKYFCNYINSFK